MHSYTPASANSKLGMVSMLVSTAGVDEEPAVVVVEAATVALVGRALLLWVQEKVGAGNPEAEQLKVASFPFSIV